MTQKSFFGICHASADKTWDWIGNFVGSKLKMTAKARAKNKQRAFFDLGP